MSAHELGADPATMIDVFTHEVAPVLTVEPGDTVRAHSLDAYGYLAPQTAPGEAQPMVFPARRGHCLLGPIAVRGARPGQLLSVRFDALRPDTWGWTRAGGVDNVLNRMIDTADEPVADLLWQLDADAGTGVNQFGLTVGLAPFLGVTGVAPAEPGEHSTIPPRPGSGGNIDCRELTAGSTLYLPIAVPDAYLFVGDGHAAQADGEVGGTAIECRMRTDLTIDVHEPGPLASVHAVTPSARITFGFDADLNVATGAALSAMLSWMQPLLGLDRSSALALAGVVVDVRVTQVANTTWGVHAVLPRSIVD